MYDPRRGSAGKLCSSNFNGKLPGEGGKKIGVSIGVCALRLIRGWISDAGGSWLGAGRAGCPDHPVPGVPGSPGRSMPQPGPATAVTGAGRAAGWERSWGLGRHRTPGSSGRVGCSSLFPSAPRALPALLPASVSPRIPIPPAAYRCRALGAFPALAPSSRLQLFGGRHGLSKGKDELWFGVTRSDRGKTQRAPWHELSMASCLCRCQGVGWGSTVPAWPYWGARGSLHCGSPWVLPGCPAGAASAAWPGGCGGMAVLVGALYPRVGVILRVHGRRVLHIHVPPHLCVCTCAHPRVHPSVCPCVFCTCVCTCTHVGVCVHPVPVFVSVGAPRVCTHLCSRWCSVPVRAPAPV